MLSEAALADLQLYLGGVRLPWGVLGGSVRTAGVDGPAPSGLVGVLVEDEVAPLVGDHCRLLLHDHENAPVAALDGVSTVGTGPAGTVAQGKIEALTRTTRIADAGGRDPAGCLVVVAMRPWLKADTARLGLDRPAGSPAPRRVVVVVASSSASPDAVPARTMRTCIDAAIADLTHADLTDVEVLPAPLAWRDPDSDHALASAVAEAFPEFETVILWPDDADWRAALAALSAGEPLPSTALASGAASALLQWRPPREQRGLAVMFTGLSGSGKSTLAAALVTWLEANTDRTVTLLDGDVVRQMLSSGLGFDLAARNLNIRRIGYVACEIVRHHGIAVCAPIAPLAGSRDEVRARVEPVGEFVLIHVATPLAECERRDRKGLYARARAGLIEDFTGISSPYEVPTNADLTLDTTDLTVSQSLARVLNLLRAGRWLPPSQP